MLKEKIIERIRRRPYILHMETHLRPVGSEDRFDLAGLILLVSGHHLQLRSTTTMYNVAQLPLSAPHIYRHWITYELKVLEGSSILFDDISIEIPALARQLWAEEYGDLEAKELPFYSNMSPNEETCEWWWNVSLDAVEAGPVLRFLSGEQPRILSKPGD